MKFLLLAIGLYSFSTGVAQIPVSQEPRHHKLLDNGYVRLLDVHIAPEDTTLFHIHATPSVFVVLTDAITGSDLISEEDRSASPIQHYGNIWFEGFYARPRIHRVYNNDIHDFNVMDIELTNKNYIIIDSPLQQEGFQFLFEEKPVRAYRLTVAGGQTIPIPPRKAGVLIIQLSDQGYSVRVDEKTFHEYFHYKGEFLFIPNGSFIRIKNEGAGNAEFAFLELK